MVFKVVYKTSKLELFIKNSSEPYELLISFAVHLHCAGFMHLLGNSGLSELARGTVQRGRNVTNDGFVRFDGVYCRLVGVR